MLKENHRQGEDLGYAKLLNQIRKGKHTANDITVLKTRGQPEGDPDMDITCINKTVNQTIDMCLNELNTELYEIEAINIHPSTKNVQPKFKKETVGETSILQTLKIKVSARVRLVHNIYVFDGLAKESTGSWLM